jgi:hypothetical protein
MDELEAAMVNLDHVGALTEVADVVYYCCKTIHLAATVTGVDIEQAFAICVAKYALRARPGNPKDDTLERLEVYRVLGKGEQNEY